MVAFNFATAQKIIFGSGRLAELGGLAAGFGRRVLLVTGGRSLDSTGRMETLRLLLDEAGVQWTRVKIEGEPTAEIIDQGTEEGRRWGTDLVVAVGGGSVMDAGKAIAALLANGGEVLDYLEGVGRGHALHKPSLPLIAIPTTAGTGSEATKNSVIGNAERTYKKSMRADGMLPAVALVDPDLVADAPPEVIAACGMDALTQLLEAFTSRQPNPMVDALAGFGLGLTGNLMRLYANSADSEACEAMALASLIGGIALANAGLGAVHGLASPLGALFPIPHGVVCATLLPSVVQCNAMKAARLHEDWLLEKYSAIAFQFFHYLHHETLEKPDDELMVLIEDLTGTGEPLTLGLKLAEYFNYLKKRLHIPGLAHYNIGPSDFTKIIEGARGNSMKTNPVDLDDEDLQRILEESL